jgi:5-methyltetrahydropteroyltriglutamate--homocysteine methyltransferase
MVIVDDIGSFPLPSWISRTEFDRIYPLARTEIVEGKSGEDGTFKNIILECFEKKLESKLNVITYPQLYDMQNQFLEPIEKYQSEPFLIESENAIIPEVNVLKHCAKELSEGLGEMIRLNVCATGPIELYLRTDFGANIYLDILENLAKSVNSFLKNSILSTPYIKTESISIDEPSLGYTDLLNIERDDLISVLERALKNVNVPVRIHIHTLKAKDIALEVDGLTTIGGEFAAAPENIDFLKKRELEKHDKFLRAGVTRTNIDSIIAEQIEMGIEPKPFQLIDEKETIKRRVSKIDSIFGERISSWGPDCGLGSWPTQDVAKELLSRTAQAVRESFK